MKKVWLITGISSGLGKALAQSVMQTGDFVIGTFRNKEAVKSFNEENVGRGEAFFMDLSMEESIETASQQIFSKYSNIDYLVNNVGLGFIGAVEEASLEEIKALFQVNVFGLIALTRKVLTVMRNRKTGTIIQISSHAGVKAMAGFGVYNATKFALEGISEAMAQELSPLGIKVVIVEPGPFRTEFAGKNLPAAKQVISDYNSTAGTFRDKLKSVHGKQEGDPAKAAQAIIKHVKQKDPTLRLPLGKIPLVTIQSKIDHLQADLDANRKIASKVVFED